MQERPRQQYTFRCIGGGSAALASLKDCTYVIFWAMTPEKLDRNDISETALLTLMDRILIVVGSQMTSPQSDYFSRLAFLELRPSDTRANCMADRLSLTHKLHQNLIVLNARGKIGQHSVMGG